LLHAQLAANTTHAVHKPTCGAAPWDETAAESRSYAVNGSRGNA